MLEWFADRSRRCTRLERTINVLFRWLCIDLVMDQSITHSSPYNTGGALSKERPIDRDGGSSTDDWYSPKCGNERTVQTSLRRCTHMGSTKHPRPYYKIAGCLQ